MTRLPSRAGIKREFSECILSLGLRADSTAAPSSTDRRRVMRITSTVTDGVAFLGVTGEVDVACADELREAGEAALVPTVGTLRIDLAGVSFMDSSGLTALIAVRNKAEAARVWLVLDDPQPLVRRALEITALHKVFVIDPLTVSGVSAERTPGLANPGSLE